MSGRPGVIQGAIHLPADSVAFGCDLFARVLSKGHGKADEFKGSEPPEIVLIIDNDVVIGREKLLADPDKGLVVELLAPVLDQVKLQEVIRQHDEDDLIDCYREGTGSEMGQIVKALELTIALLG